MTESMRPPRADSVSDPLPGGPLEEVIRSGIRGRQWNEAAWRTLGVTLFGALVIGAWQATYSLELISHFVLPSPWATAQELGAVLRSFISRDAVFDATVTTVTEIVVGFGLAAFLGVVTGVVVGDTRFGKTILMPYIVAVNSMPKVAFAPVFVAWLGFGTGPKIVLAAFISFFPVVVTTAAGVESTSANSLALFRSLEASRLQTLVKLKLPNALPYMFAGFKTAIVFAVTGAIVAEFLGGSGAGLGELISLSANRLRIDTVFALIIFLSVIGMAMYGMLVWIERRAIYWRESDGRSRGATHM